MTDLPAIEGALAALVAGTAVEELQVLLERCADFEIVMTGAPPDSHAAADLVVEVPPDHPLRDKLVIGVWTPDGLTAVIDLLRDFPAEGAWYLGLLLVAPEARSRGFGAAAFAALRAWIAAQGGRTIRLIVQAQNPRGLAFWTRMGFQQIGTAVQALEDRENLVLRMELSL